MGSLPVGLSASRGAAIIGLSKWSTPFGVWQQIMESRHPGFNALNGYEYIPFEGNNATDFGTCFEDAVIKLSEKTANNKIVDREGAYAIAGQDYITCHIDGRYDETKCNHEGKTTNSRAYGFSWGEPGTDRVPQEIQVQVQQQMMCNGSDSTIVSVLVFPKTVDEWADEGWSVTEFNSLHNEGFGYSVDPLEWASILHDMGFFHQYHIEAKPDTQKILKELYAEFWGRYIIGDEVPEAVDYSDIRRMFTAPKGTLVISDKEKIGGEKVSEIMREYRDITKEIGDSGHLGVRKKFIKNQVLKFALDKTTVADDESAEKIVFMDESGKKLGSFNGKTYRGA